MPPSPPTLLIAGCGYLGLAMVPLFRAGGWRVVGLTRTEETAREVSNLAGIETAAADLGDRDSLQAAARLFPGIHAIVHAASSSRGGPDAYRRVFVDGLANLHEVFHPAQLLFTSSTSVYAQCDGRIVTESSPAEPTTETGRLLREAESIALERGDIVTRLAGLYGPGRAVLLRKFFNREAVIEDGGTRVINQIHRDDAARAIFHLLSLGTSCGLFNVCDNQPMPQREIYAHLATRFGQPMPPEGPRPEGRKRGWSSKQVDNAKLRSTGWEPAYPTFFDALENDDRLVPSIRNEAADGV